MCLENLNLKHHHGAFIRGVNFVNESLTTAKKFVTTFHEIPGKMGFFMYLMHVGEKFFGLDF